MPCRAVLAVAHKPTATLLLIVFTQRQRGLMVLKLVYFGQRPLTFTPSFSWAAEFPNQRATCRPAG
ncbi:hypothetical protein IC229_19750 [Spirosoma sp. BT702]|uniref:Uncharacterized protein n=1 Tax=Spirosoma profusum TaxID=2771354 RepID=A0A926Y4A2_9BACT|nr:hypothetical protein [Spirosoma profusum]MBD2702891.1 hypothetical protein [Spirosoma profusum]